ncbi:MAG: hypothetical protein R3C52_04980 [Hyphomonadaceae bacterium]
MIDAPSGHDAGLQADLALLHERLMARRRMLRWFGLAGASLLTASCGGGGVSSPDTTETSSGGSSGGGSGGGSGSTSCPIPATETEGPYPADGSNSSNGVVRNVLSQSGVVRNDIRSSFADLSTTVAAGQDMTLTIRLSNSNASCSALAGYAIYIWHCDAAGRYSLYDLPNENYLRGVAVTDADGMATFTTIFPGCYAGRWPHMHFEVYPNLATATSYANKILTSQFAMDADVCSQVYANVAGYEASLSRFPSVSLASDGIFRDNSSSQMTAMTPVITGSVAAGTLSASVEVGLAR